MELWQVKVTILECINDVLFSCATILLAMSLSLENYVS